MAEVASSLGTSSQSSADSASDMPEGLLLSPSVKEAMDRILPRSASHLLQDRLSFEEAGSQNGGLSCGLRANGDREDTLSIKPGSRLSLEMEGQKKSGLKKRISKADLEIMTAADAGCKERVSRRSSSFEKPNDCSSKSLEKSSDFPSKSLEKPNDCSSKTYSDSDDVSRPFAVVREKKKEKRKRRKKQTASQELGNSLACVGDSEDDFVSLGGKDKQEVLQNDNAKTCPDFPLSNIEIVPTAGNTILTNGSPYQDKQLDSQQHCLVSDDMSNNSFSSSKENVENRKRLECQKLPRVKMSFYNIVKHKSKIKKTFPPCYIVIEQISALLMHADTKSLDLARAGEEYGEAPGKVLPLSVRLKNLSSSCEKGLISCRKNKKDRKAFDTKQRDIFEGNHIPDSEDDFEATRGGRSLRKRDKTISYVEPTEADIFLEYGRKRRRNKAKDDATESDEEVKKRKLDSDTEKSVVQQDSLSRPEEGKSPPQDCERAKCSSKNEQSYGHDYARAKPSNRGPQEVVVYPKTSSVKDASNKSTKLKPVDIRAAPASVTSLSSPAVRSLLSTQPPPGLISTFPPLITSMSGLSGMLCSTTSSRTPVIPTVAAAGMVRPQFCMVKMDGKDVLLQVLPPSSPGAASQGSTLLLPGGKRLVVPPNHHLSQQISQAPRIMNSIPLTGMAMPLISPLPHGLSTTASAINSSVSQSVPLSIPNISTSHSYSIRGIPRTPLQGTRTITTVYPPLSTTTTPAVTAPQTQAPMAMAAPNSTTVVRNIRVPASNLRAQVPNQPGGVRAVRIFVPGCQATGVPGRFATLGSVATNSSALTRLSASSDLLPQRKSAKDMLTQEERAEKRRKLEKKYPLPPGVVIKTEPLDSPSSTQSTSTYNRSLLQGNIQVVSASRRPGTSGVQSIRFLNPVSAAAALGSGGQLPLTNFIVRAASGDGRQTILIPSSLGMLTSSAAARGSPSSASIVSATPSSSSVIVTSTSAVPGGGTISILPTFTSTLSSSSTTNTTSSSVTSSDRLLLTGNESPDADSSSPPPSFSRSATTESSASVIVKLKAEIAAMNKMLVAQEAMGLRGERVEKLKDLLKKKKNMLKDLLFQSDGQTSELSENNVGSGERPDNQSTSGQSEAQPIEID